MVQDPSLQLGPGPNYGSSLLLGLPTFLSSSHFPAGSQSAPVNTRLTPGPSQLKYSPGCHFPLQQKRSLFSRHTHSAPSHLRVHMLCPPSWSMLFPSLVNSSYSSALCLGSTSSRKSSWILLMGQAPQYMIVQLCVVLLIGPHLTNSSHLFP